MHAEIDTLDSELDVLQSICAHAGHVRQSDPARITGLSLRMENAIVKRLLQKGWHTIQKGEQPKYRYAASSAGIEQNTRTSYRYSKRTIRNIVSYREVLETFVSDLKLADSRSLMIVGRRDGDFIVEHAYGVACLRCVSGQEAADLLKSGARDTLILPAETYILDEEEKASRPGRTFLQEVLSGNGDAVPQKDG